MSEDRAMTGAHPEELLAGYADGTLNERERRTVETHLAGCRRCRDESALAMRTIARLRELPDEPVPVGITRPVMAEIADRMSRPSPRPLSQRVLWAAGGAIAAAFVGLLAIWVLPGVGGGGAATSGGGGGGSVEAAGKAAPANDAGGAFGEAGSPVVLEHSSTRYDDAAIGRLAEATAASVGDHALGGPVAASAEQPAARSALACLSKGAGVEPGDVLVRLISARYGAKPALIGVFLSGPAADRRAETVLVWVVGADACDFLSYTQDRV
jgi:hypothetical protein